MRVFKMEMRSSLLWVVGWTLGLCAVILLCLPALTGAVDEVSLTELWGSGATAEPGSDAEVYIGHFGFLSYLFSFITAAAAIEGVMLGLIQFLREPRYHLSDLLLSKPITRGSFFAQKYFAGLLSLLLTDVVTTAIITLTYIASAPENLPLVPMLLIVACISLVQLFCYALGVLSSLLVPQLRRTITLSVGLLVAFFMLHIVGLITQNTYLGWVTPLGFFDLNNVLQYQMVDIPHLVVGIIVMVVLAVASAISCRVGNVKN